MELQNPLPFVVHLDDTDSPVDVIDAAALAGFVAGTHPVARTIKLSRVRSDATLLPDGVAPVREARAPWQHSTLATGDGWVLLAQRWPGGNARITVMASHMALADQIVAEARRDAVEPSPLDTARFAFWHRGSRATRTERVLPIAHWDDIRPNYGTEHTAALDRLMATEPDQIDGRLALVYGPPGTGKTTLVRGLADAWRSWCNVEYVLDAESLLAEPEYLVKVLLDDEDDTDSTKRWRLLVLEDCGEFICADAKRETGQGLSRLLNLTDGLLGQGTRLLVLISTNEELARLHPAITRPGRCFAQIRVGPLPYREAVRWLGRRDGIGPDGATLAELYSLRRDPEARIEGAPGHPGLYL